MASSLVCLAVLLAFTALGTFVNGSQISDLKKQLEDNAEVYGPWIKAFFESSGRRLPHPLDRQRSDVPCDYCTGLLESLISSFQSGVTLEELLEVLVEECTGPGETAEEVCRGNILPNLVCHTRRLQM
jgi:hypothetical protein